MMKLPFHLLAIGGILLAAPLNTAADEIEAQFRNPPHEARARTWWHWMNGNVTREGITADLEAMAESHIGGVTIFNIAGPHHNCSIPQGPADYLGPVWLDMLEHTVHEAKRLGLEVGMQNCAGWATTGGPWITPELGMQELRTSEVVIEGGKTIRGKLPQPEVVLDYYRDVAVFAVPVELDSDFRIKRWTNKAGQTAARGDFQPELMDLPEGAAIPAEKIIELTRHLAKDGTLTWEAPAGSWKIIRIGHTAKGNTNKPAPAAGTGLEIDKLRREGLDVHWKKGIQPVLDRLGKQVGETFTEILIDSYEAGLHHWTPKMREEFTRRRGYDPGVYLLALTGRPIQSGPLTERFYWDFRRTIGDLINDNYYGYWAELCHKAGLKLALEPYTSTFEGLQVGARADIPMGEFWVNGSYTHTLRTAASIAHTTGKRFAGAEAFTATPELGRWQNHPASLKKVGDHAFAVGINRLVLHGWVHQPWLDLEPGMTMGQYGSHFGRTNTWWGPGKEWLAYIARCQFLLQYGEPVNDVLVFAGNAAPNGSVYRKDLEAAGYGYDSCSTEVLHQLTVDRGDLVTPSGVRYRLLVLPKHGFHTPKQIWKIGELVRAGAKIHGPVPQHSPSLAGQTDSDDIVADVGREIWDGPPKPGMGRLFEGESPIEALASLGIQAQVVLPDGLVWLQRRKGDTDIYFISNQSDETLSALARFRTSGRIPELWNAETLSMEEVRAWSDDGTQSSLPLSLMPGKSVFVIFRRAGEARPPDASQVNKGNEKSVEHAIQTPWSLRFDPQLGTPDKLVMNKLTALNEHEDTNVRHYSGTCTYSTRFEFHGEFDSKRQDLWLDLGEVQVIAEVSLNGKELGVLWHPPFRVEVGDVIRQGENTLEVKVSNLWINRLIGDAKLPEDCEWTDKHLTRWPDWLTDKKPRNSGCQAFATWKHWGPDDALRSSGLLGPVTLREIRMTDGR